MQVEFIAHAGIRIKTKSTELVIDPWFTDSTVERPLIKEIYGYPTIDFQIPKTNKRPSEFQPDAILLSHFHAHHAPLSDIVELISSKDVRIMHPDIEVANQKVGETFKIFSNVVTDPMKNGGSYQLVDVRITALSHTVPHHLAWHVLSPTGSILHIADPRFNRDHSLRKTDEIWNSFTDLHPDILFINAGGNALRHETEGRKSIVDAAVVSPAEVAEIVALIKPKVVSLIGCYNHSMWRNREEYIRPAPIIEDEFYWAVSYLAPETKCVFVKPGHTFGLHESSLAGTVDTFVS